MNYWQATLAILALSASMALAEDFKTINGKEYKNATVSRVESDGIIVRTKSGIAEEVAAVNPDLVVRDKNGEIYTVRYDPVNAMLLNEFLKEHRKVQEQEATS